MANNDGFPPGVNFTPPNRPKNTENRQKIDQAQAQNLASIQQVYKIEGEVVSYDDDNLPDMNEEDNTVVTPPPVQKRTAQPPPQKARVQQQKQMHQQPPSPAIEQVAKKYQHPVLKRMLEKFGLQAQKKFELEIYSKDGTKQKYTLTATPDDIIIWALSVAQPKILTDGEAVATSWFQMVQICSSVVAIDDVPIWQIFGVNTTQSEQNDLSKDPFNISSRIRKTTGLELAHVLWTDTQPIGDKLYEFYMGKILPTIKLTSSYDKEGSGLVRYMCPLDGCTEYIFEKPKLDEAGHPQPFYCKLHGCELVEAATVEQENSIPLE